MARPSGSWLPLSLPRRYLCDLAHLARQVPSVVIQRRMHLACLVAARRLASPKPSWHAIFTKGLALTALAWPRLHQAYLSLPWPHLYQHPHSVASVALERSCLDDDAVFFVPVRQPERLGLVELDGLLRRCTEQSVERIGALRRCLRWGRLPGPLRRGLGWLTANGLGWRRAERLGTFTVAACSALGAELLLPLNALTATLTYGVLAPDGTVDVRLAYDARVLDGPTAARVLADLERALTHEIVAEMRYLEGLPAAA